MDKKQAIIDHLVEKYHPKSIILHGSRAKGKNRLNSDWDMYVLVDSDIKGGSELYDGESLDVCLVHLPISKEDFVDTFGYTLNTAEILFDQDNVAQTLLDEAKEAYAFGRKLTEAERQNRRNFMHRTLQRLEGYVDRPEAFFLYLGFFYEIALRYWFELRGLWSLPIYEALPYIQEKDPQYYTQLQSLSGHAANTEKWQIAQSMEKALLS